MFKNTACQLGLSIDSLISALQGTKEVHDTLGHELGCEEVFQINRFGDKSLVMDIKIEESIIDNLKSIGVPMRVISEEHGTFDIGKNPKYLVILDGLDGSGVYKQTKGRGRYGTMLAVYNGLDPLYDDYLFGGIMEHNADRLIIGVKGVGAFLLSESSMTRIRTADPVSFKNSKIYIDEYFEINRKTFSEKLVDFDTQYLKSSAIYYADVATGRANFALECARKCNLEIAVAYAIITEAGGAMVTLNGESIGDKKYMSFAQEKHVPIVTASSVELAKKLIDTIQ